MAQVLKVLLTEAINEGVIVYMHKKGCIARCLSSLQSPGEFVSSEVADIVMTIFTAVKVPLDDPERKKRKKEEGRRNRREKNTG